jgi:hypothetical protein
MHTLEHMLFMLSERIRRELGNTELTDAAKRLASESHSYERTSDGPDPLEAMQKIEVAALPLRPPRRSRRICDFR